MSRWGPVVVAEEKLLGSLLRRVIRSVAPRRYSSGAWALRPRGGDLESELRRIVEEGQIADEQWSAYGTKYVIDGTLRSPSGRRVPLRTSGFTTKWRGFDWSPPILSRSTTTYREHDVVVLRQDLPEHSLLEGDVGAVVGVYPAGGYEVEFVAAEGATVAVVTLGDDEIRPMRRHEMLRVREVEKLAV